MSVSAPALRTSTSPSPAGPGWSALGSSNASSAARAAAAAGVPDADRRMTELEIENSRLMARLSIAEREVVQKDQEMKRLLMEHRAGKTSLEKIVKELVDKNKMQESEFKRKLAASDEAVQRAMSSSTHRNQSALEVRAALEEWRRALQQKESESEHWQSQFQQVSASEEQLQSQLDVLHERVSVLEQQLLDSHHTEAELQQDLDVAMAKLAKADEHIHQLSVEAEEHTIETVRLKHLNEACDVDVQLARDGLEDTEQRFYRAAQHTAAEIDRITNEADELLEVMRDAATAHKKRRIPNATSPADDDVLPNARKLLIAPQLLDSDTSTTARSAESSVSLMKRAAEALSLVREDLAVARRAAVELASLVQDASRRIEILSEAIEQERHIAQEATDRARFLEAQHEAATTKIARLEGSVVQSAAWMDEAAAMSEESAQRTSKLVGELNDTKRESAMHKEESLRLQRQLASSQSDREKQSALLQKAELDLNELKERLRLNEKRLAGAADESDDLRARLSDRDKQCTQLENKLSQVEGEKLFLSRQVSDMEDRHRGHARQTDQLEASNADLRSKLFEAQKRLDALLRNTTVTSVTSGSGSPTPAASGRVSQSRETPPRQRPTNSNLSSSPMIPVGRSTAAIVHSLQRDDSSLGTASRSQLPPSGPPPQRFSDPSDMGAKLEAGNGADRLKSWEDRLNSLLSATRGRV